MQFTVKFKIVVQVDETSCLVEEQSEAIYAAYWALHERVAELGKVDVGGIPNEGIVATIEIEVIP